MSDLNTTFSRSPDPFGPFVSTDLRSFNRAQFSIQFQPRRDIDISEAHRHFVTALQEDIKPWYRNTFGKELESLKLGGEREEVRQRFFQNQNFHLGLETLGVVDIVKANSSFINLPWWVEKGLAEYQWKRTSEGFEVIVTERHSIETQLIRHGVDRGVVPIVMVGIVRALPDPDSSDGYIVCGIRGGVHFRNVLMLPGGALKYDPKLITGEISIHEAFVSTELQEELGIDFRNILGGMPRLHSRHDDYLLDGRAAVYAFDCPTSCTKEKINGIWERNTHSGKLEHQALRFVPANPSSIREFLVNSYRGRLRNDPDRPDTARFLSHHGALPLALEAAMTPAALKQLCRDE